MSRFWHNAMRMFPSDKQRAERELRLTQAYKAVFTHGNPTKEDREMVLADLAHLSGYAMVTPPEVDDKTFRFNEGKRYLFARIKAKLNLAPSEYDALEYAARIESEMRFREA